MKRTLIPIVAALIGAAAAYFYWSGPGRQASEDDMLRRAFSRAYAFYLNETSQDYRRARMELQPFAEELRDSVAYRLDMALIDLAELNQPVQDEDRNLGDPPNSQLLLQGALEHLERARAIEPDNESVLYNLARTYKKLAPRAENDRELREAAKSMLAPLLTEGRGERPDAGALFIYAELLEELRLDEQALAAYQRLVALGRDFMLQNQFVIAHYGRAKLINRLQGDSKPLLAARQKYGAPDPKRLALESGRYTRFLRLTDAPAVEPDPRAMNWRQTTARNLLPEAGEPRFFIAPDFDNDCRRDLLFQTRAGMRVFRARRSGAYDDLTESAGLPNDLALHAAAAGDIDNDGRADFVAGGPGGLRLFLNTTPPSKRSRWTFGDETARLPGASAPVTCLVLLDLDHDGDLDIFVGGPQGNRVYRTVIEQAAPDRRELAFTEIGEQLGMRQPPAGGALMIDVDDDDDTDLLVRSQAGAVWFESLRELKFRRRGLPANGRFAAADVDNDLLEEVGIGTSVYKWSGDRFEKVGERDALLDLDGDGVIDATPFSGIQLRGELVKAIGTDLNRDGHRDLVVMTTAGLDTYMSRPKRVAGWIDFMPRGLKANEFGVGTKIRLFADDLRIGVTCRDGLVSFGLGKRTVVDAVLFRWTNGIEQGEVQPRLADCVTIEEREGEVGSCPFLYSFDGERWHFVNDCHSGTPLGLPYADGKYLPPRSSETIMVPGDRLRPSVDGRLRLDLAEEFRELFYCDRVVLRAIDHPPHVRPVLDEGFRIFTHPKFKVHGFTDLKPPRRAVDHRGNDITELVSTRDARHAVVFQKLDSRYVGLAAKWSIDLDFGDVSKAKRIFLVMDGWVEFPTASASIASSQSKTVAFMPPIIEVPDSDGEWTVVDKDPGFPAGKGKAVLVDLTGKLTDGRLRISSTQRIHWDAFWLSTSGGSGPMTLTELPIARAQHAWRGIGKRVDVAGQPWRYSHDQLLEFHPYDQLPNGLLTRYGDVKQLLETIDDKYPVLAPGDVIHLEFDASVLPPLEQGWVRDWCFSTEGWVKDADMNQAVRETVTPLPFHAMGPVYPYDTAQKAHPHPEWVKRWFTRPARRLVNPEALGVR